MKASTKNEIKGKAQEVRGKIKEKIGHLTNNSRLEGQGIGEKIAATAQQKLGQMEKVVEKP